MAHRGFPVNSVYVATRFCRNPSTQTLVQSDVLAIPDHRSRTTFLIPFEWKRCNLYYETFVATMCRSTNLENHEATAFETIHVALMGYVSAGKTMLLNAFLKDQFGQVSMQRATAGVNFFRITKKSTTDQTSGPANKDSRKASNGRANRKVRSAHETLAETTADNQKLRSSKEVQEKVFDVELEEDLFEMRDDTKLVLVDVPGINEAGASKKYKDYVSNKWHTFDCVILVLDGRQGVNTEEQVALLKLAKDNCKKVRQIPLIVLLNKIDDPEDEEHQLIVKETTKKIEELFKVSDRAKWLAQITSGKARSNNKAGVSSPIVVPVSAVNAYIYRAAASLTLEDFKAKIDNSLVEKLGKEAYGRRWKKFKDAEKYEKAFEVIQDDDQYEDGLDASRFKDLLLAMAFLIGGKTTQKRMIEDQIDDAKSRLDPSMDYVQELRTIYKKSIRLGVASAAKQVHSRFLELHKTSVENAFTEFSKSPFEVHHLAKPMEELLSFWGLTSDMDVLDSNKAGEIVKQAKRMVLRQLDYVFGSTLKDQNLWQEVSIDDMVLICGSMLGSIRDGSLDEHLGPLARILLERKFLHVSAPQSSKHCPTCNQSPTCSQIYARHGTVQTVPFCNTCSIYLCESGDHSFTCLYCKTAGNGLRPIDKNGHCCFCGSKTKWSLDPLEHCCHGHGLVPTNTELFKNATRVQIVDAPSDPRHFGHLLWQFGNLVRKTAEIKDWDNAVNQEESQSKTTPSKKRTLVSAGSGRGSKISKN